MIAYECTWISTFSYISIYCLIACIKMIIYYIDAQNHKSISCFNHNDWIRLKLHLGISPILVVGIYQSAWLNKKMYVQPVGVLIILLACTSKSKTSVAKLSLKYIFQFQACSSAFHINIIVVHFP